MTTLSQVLEWKFDKAEGIETKNEQVTAWPKALGKEPIEEDLTEWTSEYEARDKTQDEGVIVDSSASTIAALRDNFNALLAVLRERGIIKDVAP